MKRRVVEQRAMQVIRLDTALHGVVALGELPYQCRRRRRAGRLPGHPFKQLRARDSSMKRARDMRGTITERLGRRTKARSAISRETASRTGMALVPRRVARLRNVIASPGLNMPVFNPFASAR